MPTARAARSRRPPWALMVVVAAAVTFGVVAVLVSGTPPTIPAPSPSGAPLLISYVWLGIAVFVLLGVWVGYLVVLRLTSPAPEYPRSALASILAVFLVILVLLVLFHLAGHGVVSRPSLPAPGNHSNSTPGLPPPNATAATNNSTLNWTREGALPGLPGWAPYAFLGIAVASVGLVALPFMLAYGARSRFDGAEEPEAGPVRAAISSTLSELERDPEADPRALIVALYARLLQALGGGAGPLDTMTPREIERACVRSLGVRPATARALTSLFEEARYSTRPMGRPAAERARRALGEARHDLAAPRKLA